MRKRAEEGQVDGFDKKVELARLGNGLEKLGEAFELLRNATEEAMAAISNKTLALALRQAREVLMLLRAEDRLRQASATAVRTAALLAEREEHMKTKSEAELRNIARICGRLSDVFNTVKAQEARAELERRKAEKGPTEEKMVKGSSEIELREMAGLLSLSVEPQPWEIERMEAIASELARREVAYEKSMEKAGLPKPTRKATTGLDDEVSFDGVDPERDRANLVAQTLGAELRFPGKLPSSVAAHAEALSKRPVTVEMAEFAQKHDELEHERTKPALSLRDATDDVVRVLTAQDAKGGSLEVEVTGKEALERALRQAEPEEWKEARARLKLAEERVEQLRSQLEDKHPQTDRVFREAYLARNRARTALWELTGGKERMISPGEYQESVERADKADERLALELLNEDERWPSKMIPFSLPDPVFERGPFVSDWSMLEAQDTDTLLEAHRSLLLSQPTAGRTKRIEEIENELLRRKREAFLAEKADPKLLVEAAMQLALKRAKEAGLIGRVKVATDSIVEKANASGKLEPLPEKDYTEEEKEGFKELLTTMAGQILNDPEDEVRGLEQVAADIRTEATKLNYYDDAFDLRQMADRLRVLADEITSMKGPGLEPVELVKLVEEGLNKVLPGQVNDPGIAQRFAQHIIKRIQLSPKENPCLEFSADLHIDWKGRHARLEQELKEARALLTEALSVQDREYWSQFRGQHERLLAVNDELRKEIALHASASLALAGAAVEQDAELARTIALLEQTQDELDAAYDAHAGECPKCRFRWERLRQQMADQKKVAIIQAAARKAKAEGNDEMLEFFDGDPDVAKGPVLGDIRLTSNGLHGVEVHVEVDGLWRIAIREHHDCTGGTIDHFVCTDGDKPNRWSKAPWQEPVPKDLEGEASDA